MRWVLRGRDGAWLEDSVGALQPVTCSYGRRRATARITDRSTARLTGLLGLANSTRPFERPCNSPATNPFA